jgi:hypothetical protein
VNLQGLYPNRHTDVELSSGDDDASMIDDVTTEPRALVCDEADSEGVSSAQPIAPGPISSHTLVQADPSIADQVVSSAPLLVGRNGNIHRPSPSANQQSIR